MIYYKLSIITRNNLLAQRIIRKLKKIFGQKEITNEELIKEYSSGKSFADIGALWGVDGGNSFLAEESGATKVVAVDIYPASTKFLEERARRDSSVLFVEGDINLTQTTNTIGVCDVVFCSGVIYHTPDPFHILTRLRAITGETLILNTASIPEMPGIQNGAVFYPYLNKNQREIWKQRIGTQKSITGPYEPESGYANWFWGMTPSLIESLLLCAGFKVEKRYLTPFRTIMVCKVIKPGFVAESGEWTTPKDSDSLKFRR